jgi:heme/copper-type cytochrome/quinol oxidase subunit 2
MDLVFYNNNMQHIKKISSRVLAYLVLPVALFALKVSFAHAAKNIPGQGGGSGFTNPIKAQDLSELLTSLLQVVTTLGAIVVVFFIIVAGFNYVTARGDEKKIQSATKTLTWTAVGAAVILGAQVIATAIQGTVNELGN